jgi:hypothetical protein
MTNESELAALERNLKYATDRYNEAAKAEQLASKQRCSTQNDMNAAQRQLDDYLKKLRDGAPIDSDWGLQRRHRLAVSEKA